MRRAARSAVVPITRSMSQWDGDAAAGRVGPAERARSRAGRRGRRPPRARRQRAFGCELASPGFDCGFAKAPGASQPDVGDAPHARLGPCPLGPDAEALRGLVRDSSRCNLARRRSQSAPSGRAAGGQSLRVAKRITPRTDRSIRVQLEPKGTCAARAQCRRRARPARVDVRRSACADCRSADALDDVLGELAPVSARAAIPSRPRAGCIRRGARGGPRRWGRCGTSAVG
jgi:hypothetical protein